MYERDSCPIYLKQFKEWVFMLIEDLRVLDLTDHRGEVGPWLLGRLGAEVIKIEQTGG